MPPSKLKKAIGAVKDRTSISIAKVGASASLSDLEVAIVKATRHDEYPAEERHIREILSLTCYSRAYVGACVNTIGKRLNKTKNWIVAMKALMLIQRLLTDGDPAYENEIFFATRRGTRLLNMSDFRDTSQSESWDYSAFVRTYAMYLDELLEFRMQGRRGKRSGVAYEEEEEEANPPSGKATPLQDMKNDRIFSKIQHLMQLLERFLGCRPTGMARSNRLVLVALYPIMKDSFQIYYDMAEILGTLLERFKGLEISELVKVYEIFCRVAKQFDELDMFYTWSKTVAVARASEYPEVEKITQSKLEVMDEFIREKSDEDKVKYLEAPKETEENEEEEAVEEDMNAIKALPAPEDVPEETEEKKEEVEETPKEDNKTQLEADLLNLGEDAPTTEEHGNCLALALFDGAAATGPNVSTTSAWEAFNSSGDWETALVQSASHLSNQQASLPGGFDMLLLDGMYQQGAITAAMASSGYVTTGSASSVALGSTGRPAMLALPAPPTPDGASTSTTSADPFAASLAVAPPPYVQMSEMEKKQRLLVEEQMMWQQYARDGRQGHVAAAKMQQKPYPYNTEGYTRSYG